MFISYLTTVDSISALTFPLKIVGCLTLLMLKQEKRATKDYSTKYFMGDLEHTPKCSVP